MKYTVDQIADAAENACFYVTPDGLWLRMQYCEMDEGYFMALDEDTGEEYKFSFDEIVEEGGVPEFYELARMKIQAKESEHWVEP